MHSDALRNMSWCSVQVEYLGKEKRNFNTENDILNIGDFALIKNSTKNENKYKMYELRKY